MNLVVTGTVGWGIAQVILASCGDEHDLMRDAKRRTPLNIWKSNPLTNPETGNTSPWNRR